MHPAVLIQGGRVLSLGNYHGGFCPNTPHAMTYVAQPERYAGMSYRRCGQSGLKLPAISLGLWHNFGHTTPLEIQRTLLRTAFDLGITHFDLANNYGNPYYGSAESNFGEHLRRDFRPYRDELVISTKAGYDMWPGPYGIGGSRKYVLSSLDQSLQRMGLDYVDIFYSHRFDTDTPLEETMDALASAVHQGKALYVGISRYSSAQTQEAVGLLRARNVPVLIHQPPYNLVNRALEKDVLGTLGDNGIGCIAFSPLAQGLLTNKYLQGVPRDARINRPGGLSFKPEMLNAQSLAHVRGLNALALARGQSLAQMAIAWVLRDPRMTSALIGASRPEQIVELAAALQKTQFSDDELAQIDALARQAGIPF